MTQQAAPDRNASPSGDKELLDVAARLLGVQTVDLVKVFTRADGTLVVLLGTGQKYTFSPSDLAAQLGADLATYLQGLTSALAPEASVTPAPEPRAPAAAAAHTSGKAVGAGAKAKR
jgi:hypothetical protein